MKTELPTKPAPLYPCHFCNEEYSWPASDLYWSSRFKDWVCGECWCGNCHDDDYEPDEMGERLSDYLQDITEKELATLRAKAKAYDEGEYLLSCIGADLNISVVNISESNYMQQKGYTCSKVRVCKEVES